MRIKAILLIGATALAAAGVVAVWRPVAALHVDRPAPPPSPAPAAESAAVAPPGRFSPRGEAVEECAVRAPGRLEVEQPPTSRRIPAYPESIVIGSVTPHGEIRLCQFGGYPTCPTCPPAWPPRRIDGVDSARCNPCGEARWTDRAPIPFQLFGQGEYVGPHRPAHVPEYRLRVDDRLDFVYRLTRIQSATPYELNVGDRIRVESVPDPTLDRELVVQPDGTVTLRLLGQVPAARLTVDQLRENLEVAYQRFYHVPAITVTPLQVNTKLEDLRAAVDGRFGAGGQTRSATVTPEGTVQLPGIGSVCAQGLTLMELKREVDEQYAQIVDGIEVTPVLTQRAPRFIFVVGEVSQPGRFVLEGPTTVMGAISLAGGWNPGGNLREVVVFRRAEDWRLMATKTDIQGGLLGKRPTPSDEIWLRDSDIVLVPKSPIQLVDDFVGLYFTRALYGVIPLQGISLNFAKASTL